LSYTKASDARALPRLRQQQRCGHDPLGFYPVYLYKKFSLRGKNFHQSLVTSPSQAVPRISLIDSDDQRS
jgi:hypothetical protein